MPEPADRAARKVAARNRSRRAARRREVVAELRVAESVIAYASQQLSNGISPDEARETALEASAQLSELAVALRKLVRLPVAQRRLLVASLTDAGYTQEQITRRAGVALKTVQRDLAQRRAPGC